MSNGILISGEFGGGTLVRPVAPRFTQSSVEGGSGASIDSSSGDDEHGDSARQGSNFVINVVLAITGSILFFIVFVWFEFLRAIFAQTFERDDGEDITTVRLWFAVFITVLGIVLVYMIYRIYLFLQ